MTSFWRRASTLIMTAFRADPPRFVWTLLLTTTVRVLPLVSALFVKLLVDSIIDGESGRITVFAVCAGVTAALVFVAQRASTRAGTRLIEVVSLRFERDMVRLASRTPGLGHLENPEYLDKLEQLRFQPRALGLGGYLLSSNILGGLQQALMLGILLVGIHPILLLLPAVASVNVWATRRSRAIANTAFGESAEDRRRAKQFFDFAVTPSHAEEVRTLRIEEDLVRRHDEAWTRADEHMGRAERAAAKRTGAAGLIFVLAYILAVTLVVEAGIRGNTTPGDVVMTIIIAGLVTQQLVTIVESFGLVSWGLLIADKYVWLVDHERAEIAERPNTESVAPPDRLRDGIHLNAVSFRYPGTDRDVLDGVNLRFPAGTIVAVVGENGAGKTTLVKLLTGMYQPTSGQITVDDVALDRIDPTSWRAGCSAAFQDFARFELALLQSVAVGDLPRVDDAHAAHQALQRAGADGLVEQVPLGFDTPVGTSIEGGVQLSGGQWQKVALGRAMMREHPLLLVFDEPTASLDPDAERALFTRWTREARHAGQERGAVTILVSHRLSTVRMADQIVVLAGTAVAEVGTHDELIARRGVYAELYQLQAGGYR